MGSDSTGLVFAGNTLSDGLFKFRSVSNANDVDRVKKLLSGELYFSTYSQLNDPFEMRVSLKLDKNRAKRLHGIHQATKRSPIFKGLSPAKRLVKAAQISNRLNYNPSTLRNAANAHFQRMRTECFIFCLSATRDHPLLWSHYANNHTGVCIRFDHKANPFFGSAKVMYDEDFPTVTYPLVDNFSELTQKSILTKADYWSYEEEYRLFSVRMENESWHLGLNWSDAHRAHVLSAPILGLTLGAMISPEREEQLLRYCKTNLPKLSIDKAVISEDRFSITFNSVRF